MGLSCKDDCEVGAPVDSSQPADSADSGAMVPAGINKIILITYDTTRFDYFNDERMPFIMARSREAVVLENHWTHSWTYPGLGALMSGTNPISWGTASWDRGEKGQESPMLDPSVDLLAAELSEQGWATAYWTSSYVASTETGLERGYQQFEIVGRNIESAELAAEIATWSDANPDVPQLIHAHFTDAHAEYSGRHSSCEDEVRALDASKCPYKFGTDSNAANAVSEDLKSGAYSEADSTFPSCYAILLATYGCSVRQQDADIEELWTDLSERGLLDDALVVLTTDHGEGLLDPFASHSDDLRSTVSRSWAMFWQPALLTPAVISAPTEAQDIIPSIMEITDRTVDMPLDGMPYSQSDDSRMLLQFWLGASGAEKLQTTLGGLYQGQHYLLESNGNEAIYDAKGDPLERYNLIGNGGVLSPELEEALAAQAVLAEVYR